MNAPGTYSLPLVYGNAIKNGAVNSRAFTSQATGRNALNPFVNHLGNPITPPYIRDHAGCTPASACLVWQDEPGLLTDVRLSDDRLVFTVDRATIRQGDAIVAVRDSENTIMWSWHIWVTDYVLDDGVKTVTIYQGVKYDVMPVNVGWCDASVYEARSVLVRVTQAESGIGKIFSIDQLGVEETGNNPYFQWGRKDPMLGVDDNRSKTCYADNDEYRFDTSGKLRTHDIHPGIRLPYCMQIVPSLSPYTYCNLWSADDATLSGWVGNDRLVVKTVYDPSPAGYCVPASAAFTGFSTTGNEVLSDTELFNVSGAFDKGWNFYCGLNRTGETIFFPAVGRRLDNGVIQDMGIYSRNTTANLQGYGFGLALTAGVDGVDPFSSLLETSALSLRSVREK